MSEPAPFDRWSADLESVLRRYLSATPVPPADHSALLMDVAQALAPHANATPAQALAVLVEGVGEIIKNTSGPATVFSGPAKDAGGAIVISCRSQKDW